MTTTPTAYSVTDWQDRYENNRSRLLKELNFVLVPNNHDSEVYGYIMADKNAAKIFAAWILILQVASRCNPRGTLVRQDGTPHDSASLAMRTRAPASWFDVALPFLSNFGWLSRKSLTVVEAALGCQNPALGCHQTVTEEKRREGKEQKGMYVGRAAPAAAPVDDSVWLDGLRANPAYAGMEVDREIAKARTWAETKRRKCSRAFIVNWLNRAERPIASGIQSRPAPACGFKEPANWREVLNHEFPDSIYSAGKPNEAKRWTDISLEAQRAIIEATRRTANDHPHPACRRPRRGSGLQNP